MFLVLLATCFLCFLCFSHTPHVYLIHIKTACIKANNLNKVSAHRNVSLEMTAPPHQAAYGGAILPYYSYVFICLFIPVIIASSVHCFSPLYLSTCSHSSPGLGVVEAECLLSASEQAGFRPDGAP